MREISRRQLFGHAAGTLALPYLVTALSRAGITVPASERLTMGAIGLGGQGMHNLKNFLTFPDLHVVAVCDVDADHLKRAKDTVDTA